MYFKKEIGNNGENISVKYLTQNNYEIIERNFLCKQGELDIIAKDLNTKEIVFIEVKTRTNQKYGAPVDAVDRVKQKHIYKAAQYYLYKNHIENVNCRIDIIEVFITRGKKLHKAF